jgi:hypothetical protein
MNMGKSMNFRKSGLNEAVLKSPIAPLKIDRLKNKNLFCLRGFLCLINFILVNLNYEMTEVYKSDSERKPFRCKIMMRAIVSL